MFLFERIFGVVVYLFVLILVCVHLLKSKKKSKRIFVMYTVVLSLIAFFFKPYVTADLYKIYGQMDLFSKLDFMYFCENYLVNSSTPAARLLYWLIGKTGINALLPVLSCVVCYSIIFYIILKTQKLFLISNTNVAYVLFFVMTGSIYMSVIGGIRMMLAISMVSLGFFRNTVEKKFNLLDVLLYGLSVFIHMMAWICVVICYIVALFDSKKSALMKFCTVLATLAIVVMLPIDIKKVFFDLIEKSGSYINGDMYFDVWEYIMGCLMLLQLIISLLEYRTIFCSDKKYQKLKSFNKFGIICLLIAVIFCFEFSIFYRFGGQLAVILLTPMMLVTLEKSKEKQSKVIKKLEFKKVFIMIGIAEAIISFTRGSMSSLKFFEL